MATDFLIPLGSIASGKWCYLLPTGDCELKINDLGPFIMTKDRPTESWIAFTSLKVKNTGADAIRLTYAVGGE